MSAEWLNGQSVWQNHCMHEQGQGQGFTARYEDYTYIYNSLLRLYLFANSSLVLVSFSILFDDLGNFWNLGC